MGAWRDGELQSEHSFRDAVRSVQVLCVAGRQDRVYLSFYITCTVIADLDPDYVFGPPKCGSGTTSMRYGLRDAVSSVQVLCVYREGRTDTVLIPVLPIQLRIRTGSVVDPDPDPVGSGTF